MHANKLRPFILTICLRTNTNILLVQLHELFFGFGKGINVHDEKHVSAQDAARESNANKCALAQRYIRMCTSATTQKKRRIDSKMSCDIVAMRQRNKYSPGASLPPSCRSCSQSRSSCLHTENSHLVLFEEGQHREVQDYQLHGDLQLRHAVPEFQLGCQFFSVLLRVMYVPTRSQR